jgi:hypothetical protein
MHYCTRASQRGKESTSCPFVLVMTRIAIPSFETMLYLADGCRRIGTDRDRLGIIAQPAGWNRPDLGMKGSELPLDKQFMIEIQARPDPRNAGSKSFRL